MRPHRSSTALSIAAAILVVASIASPGRAADLYVSGDLVMSGAISEASGSTPFFTITGSDADSSPGYGGSLGLGVALPELFPSLERFESPDAKLRFELEGVMGRDWELLSQGGGGFFTQANTWSVMTNLWVDLPVRRPLAWAFGRVPVLDPLAVYGGGGIGLANLDLATTATISEGSLQENRFAWQAGAGIAYEFSDWATLSLGWRYLGLGEAEMDLAFIGGGGSFGSHTLDLSAHEVVSRLRVDFYSRPLKELSPERWSMPRPSPPRWTWPWKRRDLH